VTSPELELNKQSTNILWLVCIPFVYILHSLLYNGISSGLYNDQVTPLHNHNTDEECRVACGLDNLSGLVGLHQTTKHKNKGMFKGTFGFSNA